MRHAGGGCAREYPVAALLPGFLRKRGRPCAVTVTVVVLLFLWLALETERAGMRPERESERADGVHELSLCVVKGENERE